MVSPSEAMIYARAIEGGFPGPDLIFVRDDGWTLGAPKDLARAAWDTWPEAWVGVWSIDTKASGAWLFAGWGWTDAKEYRPPIRFTATRVDVLDLQPGDLFSSVGPEYWGAVGANPRIVGEKVFVRTSSPPPADRKRGQEFTFRITIE